MHAAAMWCLLISAPAWHEGDHFTSEWGGARTFLSDHGVTIDAFYTIEVFGDFVQVSRANSATTFLGHLDLQVTYDTTPDLWPGGKLVVLAQATHGQGINATVVHAFSTVSNLESPAFVQLGEWFIEQSLFDGVLVLRFGKQDSNRDFGAPRYGGNFINDSFGAVPTVPTPSYIAQGLGGFVQVKPTEWLTLKAGIYEGQPQPQSFGFDSALAALGQIVFAGGAFFRYDLVPSRHYWALTSLSAWTQNGSFDELSDTPSPRTFNVAYGGFVLHDMHFGHVTINVRAALTPPDRQDPFFYFGAAVAYHELPWASDDTVGIGSQVVRFSHPRGGSAGPGDELMFEVFYKARLTKFFSLQPDFQIFNHVGGDGPFAVVGGLRVKVKL